MQYLGSTEGPHDLATQKTLPGPDAVALADVTGGVNSTADFEFASLTIPAGFITQTGLSWLGKAFTEHTKANGGLNLLYWVKINGTKVAIATFAQGNWARTALPARFEAGFTIRSIGVSGVIAVATHVTGNLLNGAVGAGGASGTVTVDTGNAVTLVIGANLSAANAGHSLTAKYAKVGQA